MRILIDMNLSPRWSAVMQAAGFESVHWSTIGPFNAPDAQIMAYAADRDFVVLTHDLDFSAILAATGGRKPSVVQPRADDIGPDVQRPRVVGAIRQSNVELTQGALLTIDAGRNRLRLLPLRPG